MSINHDEVARIGLRACCGRDVIDAVDPNEKPVIVDAEPVDDDTVALIPTVDGRVIAFRRANPKAPFERYREHQHDAPVRGDG